MTTTVSLRRLLGLFLIGLVLGSVLVWRQGTFDRTLWRLHLNYKECARDSGGTVVCGADLEEYERRIASVSHPKPLAAPAPPTPATDTQPIPSTPVTEAPPAPPPPAPATAPTQSADGLASRIEAGLATTGVQSPRCTPVGTGAGQKISCTFEDPVGRRGGITATQLNDPVLRLAMWRRERTEAGVTNIVQLGWMSFDSRTGQFGPVNDAPD